MDTVSIRRPSPGGRGDDENASAVAAAPYLHEVVHHAGIEVLAAEMRVASRRLHLEDAVLDREDRHVERAAAEVEDEHVALAADLLVEAVRDRRRRRLVDDAQHVQAGDGAGVLRRLAPRVVEVGGYRDDRLLYRLRRGWRDTSADTSQRTAGHTQRTERVEVGDANIHHKSDGTISCSPTA